MIILKKSVSSFACMYFVFVLQYLYKEENIRASAQHRKRRFGFGHLKRLFFAQKRARGRW